MTASATAKAGTPEFRYRLLRALTERFPDGGDGPVQLAEGEWVSRNTVIFHGTAGGQQIIAKAQATKPPSVVKAEYHLLTQMEHTFNGHRIRALRPLALLEDLGVLVTVREYGVSLRDVIAAACLDPGQWVRALHSVEAAARALRVFHERFSQPRGLEGCSTPNVRWYLDFTPKNVLIEWPTSPAEVPSVVLMDPPEEERWGSECEDIGGFCYGMTRIRFLPTLLRKPSVPRNIDRLKARFIRQYYAPFEPGSCTDTLDDIRAAEHRRATQALRWYMRPFRYRSPAKELLRLCYLGPLTLAYRAWGLDRSYHMVSRLLRENAQ